MNYDVSKDGYATIENQFGVTFGFADPEFWMYQFCMSLGSVMMSGSRSVWAEATPARSVTWHWATSMETGISMPC